MEKGGVRVLVVDDEPVIRAMLAEALSDEGYAVTGAGSGEEALELLDGESGAEDMRPQMVLLDLQLRGMSGVVFAEEYRRRPGPHAPILVLTALRGAEGALKRVRPMAVLEKPFELRELLKRVEEALAGDTRGLTTVANGVVAVASPDAM